MTANTGRIKDDLSLYITKIFQFSVLYIGALFTVLVGSQHPGVKIWADNNHLKLWQLLVPTILVLNLLYLIVATSCWFAVLKRAYFLLRHGAEPVDEPDALQLWEVFTRVGAPDGFARRWLRPSWAWGIDNYFAGAVYLLVMLISLLVFLFGLFHCGKLLHFCDAHSSLTHFCGNKASAASVTFLWWFVGSFVLCVCLLCILLGSVMKLTRLCKSTAQNLAHLLVAPLGLLGPSEERENSFEDAHNNSST